MCRDGKGWQKMSIKKFVFRGFLHQSLQFLCGETQHDGIQLDSLNLRELNFCKKDFLIFFFSVEMQACK